MWGEGLKRHQVRRVTLTERAKASGLIPAGARQTEKAEATPTPQSNPHTPWGDSQMSSQLPPLELAGVIHLFLHGSVQAIQIHLDPCSSL